MDHDEESSPEVTLIASTGMSPAILTETIWALAHLAAPVLPHRVNVLTTSDGRDKIRTDLLAPSRIFGGVSPWQAMRDALDELGHDLRGRLRFGETGDDIRVFTRVDGETGQSQELSDIRTPEDNVAIADFTLNLVRGITENPDTQLIASIAGGRKTMGAVLYGCMNLLGREGDRLNHVLVSRPFDDPRLSPPFYFPAQRTGPLQVREGGTADPAEAEIELAEVPFVPLRNLFYDELGQLPGGFSAMVEKCAKGVLQKSVEGLVLRVSFSRREVQIGARSLSLNTRAMLALCLLGQRLKRDLPPAEYRAMEGELDQLAADIYDGRDPKNFGDWRHDLASFKADPTDLSKGVSDLRGAFIKIGADGKRLADALPRGKFAFEIDRDQIQFGP